MTVPRLRRALTTALVLTASLPTLFGAGNASAARQEAPPPPSIDAARPTIIGTLVAKPVPGTGNGGPILCNDQDVTKAARAVMINRGLVICTEEGRLVLLQLSAGTRFYDRLWDPSGIRAFVKGDHIRAWGVLRAGGSLVAPTYVVQDISRARSQVIRGTLVARPLLGDTNNGPIVCRDRDVTRTAQTLLVNRGLVICTAEGKLVLLQLSATTRIFGRDRIVLTVNQLTKGDHIIAWGLLADNGLVLNPTSAVQDTDTQTRATNSQDFISGNDRVLTLDVLQSDAGGPVQGIVHAFSGGGTHVFLCGGRAGTWKDLASGMTVNINGSVFDRRTMTYVDTDTVRVVSCS